MALSTAGTILKNTFSLMTGQLISRALQFVLLIYATRVLGPTQYGIFSFAYATTGIMSVCLDLGTSSYTVQQLSRDMSLAPKLTGAGFVVRGYLISISLAVIMLVGWLLNSSAAGLQVLLIFGLLIAFDSLAQQYSAIFTANERMEFQAIIVVICNTAMSLTGILLLYLYPNLYLFTGTFMAGAAARFFLSRAWARKKYGKLSWDFEKELPFTILKRGLPFALVSIFVTIYYYIDTVILTAYTSKEIVGYYNASFRLLEGPLFIASALTISLFPAASRLYHEDVSRVRELTRRAVQQIIPIGFTMSWGVAFFSDEIIRLLYGPEYAPSARALPILMFTLTIIMPSTILGTTIRAIGRQTVSAWVTGAGALLNVLLNLLIIPRYSFVGASWTTLATEVFVLVVYFSLAHRYIGLVVEWSYLFRLGAYVGLMIGLLFVSEPLGMWIQSAIYCMVCLPLMVGLRLVDREIIDRVVGKLLPGKRKRT